MTVEQISSKSRRSPMIFVVSNELINKSQMDT